jgi:hypothetical protein
MLDACIASVLAALKASTPGMGEHVALDGSDLPAYANGQRYLSKGGPERERYPDPDAPWGQGSAVSTRKGGAFYGYEFTPPRGTPTCGLGGASVSRTVSPTRQI